MGAITDIVKRYVPASYRAMVEITIPEPRFYSQAQLQSLADYVQYRLIATVAGATLEATTYDPLLLEFMGKVTTLRFIPAAIDYWGDQELQSTRTGVSETTNFPDRRTGLWKVFEELQKEVAREFNELAGTYGFIIRGTGGVVPQVSYGDNGRGVLLTPDPQDWEPQGRSGSSTRDPMLWTLAE